MGVVPGEAEVVTAVRQLRLSVETQPAAGHQQGVDHRHLADHQVVAAVAVAFGPEEPQVELADVVSHDDPTGQQLGQEGMDVAEGGGPGDHGGRDPVDMGRSRIASGVEHRAEGVGSLPLGSTTTTATSTIRSRAAENPVVSTSMTANPGRMTLVLFTPPR